MRAERTRSTVREGMGGTRWRRTLRGGSSLSESDDGNDGEDDEGRTHGGEVEVGCGREEDGAVGGGRQNVS
jgi:hypothetical protein